MSESPISVDVARALYESSGGAHDFDHVRRVVALAEQIAVAEGADLAIVRTAALLHDVGLAASGGRGDHHLRGADLARSLLSGEPGGFVEAVAHAIAAHRFRAEPEPRTLEAQVLSDADKLDAIGAIGVARVFAYAGAQDTPLWRRPWQEIQMQANRLDPGSPEGRRLYTPVHEFVYKLDDIPRRLYTPTARTLAVRRHAFMQAFFTQLDNEMAALDDELEQV